MDPISNMLIMLKNASRARHEKVSFPYSKLKFAILECLKKEGIVKAVEKKTKKGIPVLEVDLIYTDTSRAKIRNVERISKPSRRMYIGVKEIKTRKTSPGIVVLSTPKGIMTDLEARKEMVGGEVLFSIA